MAHGADGDLAQHELLDAAGHGTAGTRCTETCWRGGAGELQQPAGVGRLEIEGDIRARQGGVVARDRATNGQPGAQKVRHLDIGEAQRAALQGDVDVDAADRLLLVDQPRDPGFQPDGRTSHGRRSARRLGGGRGAGGRLLPGRRDVGIEIDRVDRHVGYDRERHAEGHCDPTAALEVVEFEDGVGYGYVAACRGHLALHAEARELGRRNVGHVDVEPGQRLAQLGSQQSEIARHRRPGRRTRHGRPRLQGHFARQGRGEPGNRYRAAARLQFHRDIADRLLVVDDLGEVDRQFGGQVGGNAVGGGRRRRRWPASGRGRRCCGSRRHRCRGPGKRCKPPVEVELGHLQSALQRKRGLPGNR